MAEECCNAVEEGNSKTQSNHGIEKCQRAVNDAVTMRKSFIMEFTLLKQVEKRRCQATLEEYDLRIANLSLRLKSKQGVANEQSVPVKGGDQQTSHVDHMVCCISLLTVVLTFGSKKVEIHNGPANEYHGIALQNQENNT